MTNIFSQYKAGACDKNTRRQIETQRNFRLRPNANCEHWKRNTKNFIYERQKHIRSVSTLAQQARKEFFNFNYIWTFLWAKQWELGSDESRMRRSIKCTTGHLQENCSLVSCIRCSIDRAEKQFNCNNKIKSLKFGQKVLKHEWDGRARSDRLIVASWNWWKEMTIAF